MTDDPDDRMLRLNAALDGELDAMSALELERELAADPALAAEYRRLEALREAIRRAAPREAAPNGLADRIAALAAPAARPRRPSCSRRGVRLERGAPAGARRLVRRRRLRRRRGRSCR